MDPLPHIEFDALAIETQECRRLAPKYNAVTEAVQWDGTRVDLLSDEFAIEADWSHKCYEGAGQALWYSIVTGKKPGLLLLVRDRANEAHHIYRAIAICQLAGVKLFIEEVDA